MMSDATARRVFPPAPTAARAVMLRGHPLADSFNSALANAWVAGARDAGAAVRVFDVHALEFEPALRNAHRIDTPLEDDLRMLQTALADAAHIVVAYPVWWGGVPAIVKGLLDRVLTPGWAYARGTGPLPEKGLTGRTGRLLLTMDTPGWYDRLVYGACAHRQMRRATFHFVGIRPTRVRVFSAIEKSTPTSRANMLAKARADGRRDGRGLVRRFGR